MYTAVASRNNPSCNVSYAAACSLLGSVGASYESASFGATVALRIEMCRAREIYVHDETTACLKLTEIVVWI